MNSRKMFAGLVFAAAITLFIQGGWIQAKAVVAQWLLQDAWQQSRVDGGMHKPWAWADHWPVARLQVPDMAVDQIILSSDSGHALAFAPGHNALSALPPGHGLVIFSGHRDTHFAFLRDIKSGMRVLVETPQGSRAYRVSDMQIVDADKVGLDVNSSSNDLLLITCYPFESLTAGGSLRYLVRASVI